MLLKWSKNFSISFDELEPIWQEWLNTQYGEKPVTEIARDFVGVALEHDL